MNLLIEEEEGRRRDRTRNQDMEMKGRGTWREEDTSLDGPSHHHGPTKHLNLGHVKLKIVFFSSFSLSLSLFLSVSFTPRTVLVLGSSLIFRKGLHSSDGVTITPSLSEKGDGFLLNFIA